MTTELPSSDALEAAFTAAAADPSKRPDFYRTLLESTLYIIDERPAPHHDGKRILEADEELPIRNILFEGVPHVPVFSSVGRLRAVATNDGRYVGLRARDLFTIVSSSHILLNPGSTPSKQFTPAEIASLLDGSIFSPRSREVVAKERQILLGQPAEYPTHIVDALKKFFGTRKQVRAAYLAHYMDPASGTPPHTLIGIDQRGDWEPLIGEASLVLDGVCRKDELVDFVKIEDSDEISEYMTSQTKPFYKKKSFWQI